MKVHQLIKNKNKIKLKIKLILIFFPVYVHHLSIIDDHGIRGAMMHKG